MIVALGVPPEAFSFSSRLQNRQRDASATKLWKIRVILKWAPIAIVWTARPVQGEIMKLRTFPAIVPIIAAASLILGFIPCVAHSQDHAPQAAPQHAPSTPEERAKAVKIAHELETDPLAKDAKEQRAWVIKWIVEIPDITVNACFDYFGEVPKPPRGHSIEITWQMVVSSAAFMIEHPDKAKDEQAVTMSGLEGALKAYQAILKQDSSTRWPFVDKLVQMRDERKLEDYVTETRRKCSQEQEEPDDPNTMHAQVRVAPVWKFANLSAGLSAGLPR